MASISVWLLFSRHLEPSTWPHCEAQVVSFDASPVGSTGISKVAVGFRYSIGTYERLATYVTFGPGFEVARLSKFLPVGSRQVIRYDRQDFDRVDIPALIGYGTATLLFPMTLCVFCGVAARWSLREALGEHDRLNTRV